MMVARSGVIAGDVEGCHSVIVEGTVIGNVSASVVVLRRYANVQGNVWCKDLAAAATAVFRNRATESPVPSSSSSSHHHRRSSSTSSGVIGDAGSRSRGGSGSGSGGRALTPPASSSGNRTTQPTPSPDSDRQVSSTTMAAMTADDSDMARRRRRRRRRVCRTPSRLPSPRRFPPQAAVAVRGVVQQGGTVLFRVAKGRRLRRTLRHRRCWRRHRLRRRLLQTPSLRRRSW
ncbi:unnamed protein product [Ectocarpus sp. 13 AM-2016]